MSSLFNISMAAVLPSSTPLAGHLELLPGLSNGSRVSWLWTAGAVVFTFLALEQSLWRYRKRHLPGDSWTIPVIGRLINSMHPTLENYIEGWKAGPLSAVTVFNIFIVMATTNEYSRKVFNSPLHAEPCLVNSAKSILRPDNWVFLGGKVHVDYRRGLNSLFTRKALGVYTAIQDSVCRKHLNRWIETCKKNPSDPMSLMVPIRDLNMETSLRVFCGAHITEAACLEIEDKYWDITLALELVNFPFAFPGTKVYRAIQARKVAMRHLEHAAKMSKESVAAGNEPTCMLEQWMRDIWEPTYKGRKEFSDTEMAMVVFSFLFAAQDAMSSGTIYGIQHLADHPEILAKVREEQARVRGGDFEKPMTMDMLDEMPYLRAVVRESMRLKPPVTMVPYKATKAFPISDDYTVPSGAMIIASIYPSAHDPEVYANPGTFDPDRWLDPESSANANPKNYMIFGSGPHRCIGEQYAVSNTALVLGNAAALMDWEHVVTPESDQVSVIATLFPKDGLLMKFKPRV